MQGDNTKEPPIIMDRPYSALELGSIESTNKSFQTHNEGFYNKIREPILAQSKGASFKTLKIPQTKKSKNRPS